MTVALALLSSALWGIADFLGGRGARRLPTLLVVGCVQLAGVVFATAVFVVAHPQASAEGVLWGLAAGCVGALAIGTFYAALAAGAMSLVAPLAACGAVIPAGVAIAGGESPSALVLAGFALALGGAALVAREPAAADAPALHRRALGLAAASAVLIGLLLTLLQHAAELDGSSAWTAVTAARAASAVVVLVALLVVRPPLRAGRADLRLLLVAGVFDTSANGLFGVATERGSDAVAAVLGSLYPVMTVVLAALVLHERVARAQAVGIAVALAGVVLVSAG
ncbi:EamA family transporter [Conexibacter sp. W3-3-2]|uniref:DMT family transporter n=1 Tax=Conexibacter sp. W3-3-2 TaxID=2675227 RepID=UPI0012B7C86A|nr:DMT family transporter [Conexibacter sp. W3-3-2]MTD43981.1 EamA family transporter [Conexibacter sp. W3-3-2]